MTRLTTFRALVLLGTSLSAQPCLAQAGTPSTETAPSLDDGFRTPPPAARPRVWWHWMNGNITKDGIAKDLAWMKRIGIGGLTNFDVNLVTPKIVDHRIAYMTPEWKNVFRYTADLAAKLDLELAIASSPGWSETGGPWVPPADAMKKLVWSETEVTGGRPFAGRLPQPPSVTGPFQNLPYQDELAGFEGRPVRRQPSHYGDVAVLAYRLADAEPAAAATMVLPQGTKGDAARLTDDDLESGVDIPLGSVAAPSAIVMRYAAAQPVRSATVMVKGALPPLGGEADIQPVLEVREGAAWRKVADVPLASVPTTVSFDAVRGREFRVVFGHRVAAPAAAMSDTSSGIVAPPMPFGPPRTTITVTRLVLSPEARVDRFEIKAGFALTRDYYALDTSRRTDAPAIAPADVIDLTTRMKPDGSLDWRPGRGRWRVIRLGYSLIGTTNHPAPEEATGFEVDKYDGAAVRRYLETYLRSYRDATGPDLFGNRGVGALLTDSIEAGASNWTPRMIEEFRRRRGYDPVPFLPTLTGTIVASPERSDAFLYDFRRTLADLIADQHYGTVAQVAHENGLKVYGEALENGRPSLGDDMAMRAHTDVPQAAMWTYSPLTGPTPGLLADMKGAASVAHVYGQNIAAAESLTSALMPWAHAPSDLRRVIDLEFAYGINRPVIHTSVHQPVDDKVPGLSLFIFGQYFNRHESWAGMAKPWVDYMARSSFLLQQGRNVADLAYFYGEEAPLTALYGSGPPRDAPVRHAYDFVNADALADQLQVAGDRIVSKGGASYRALYLGGSSARMTIGTLRRIAALAEAGATVIGRPPVGLAGLDGTPQEFAAIVGRLWSASPVTSVGKGRVVRADSAGAGLQAIGTVPDFAFAGDAGDPEMLFVHRGMADGDVYFINNRRPREERGEARFRVTGREPELWRADTGERRPLSYRVEGDTMVVPLDLAAEDSIFVVFRTPTTQAARTVASAVQSAIIPIAGPWTVSFQRDRGAPASTRLAKLAPLSTNALPGIRFFSGVATYTTAFTVPADLARGTRLQLDLGRVGDLAEVSVNGHAVGTTWHAPYRVDITDAVRPGSNRLEVRVANLWVNRLIGDQQPGAVKVTWTAQPTYRADAPLRPSGLIGPVMVIAERTP